MTSSGAAPEQVRRATMPIQIMVISQLLVLAAVLISLLLGWPWWAALLIAIVSLALVLGRWGGQTVRHWAVTGFKYLTGRTYRSSGSIADTPSGQDSWTGTRWENGKLITVLEISATQRHPSVITPDHCATDSLVPLRVLRECMHQNDIELESIDVISNGQRTAQGTVLRGGYDRLVGPLPAVAIRTVWVVLRFDPGANVDAVFRRGGGRRGAERCAVIATARVRRALAAAHCASTILQAGQIHRISAEMLRQYAGAPMHEDWSGLTLIDSYNVAMGIDPWYITDATLTGLWARPTLETSVTVRLRPAAKGRTSVGALVRWATDEQLPVRHSTGMTSLNGSQRDAFFAGLPVGAIGLEYLTRAALLIAIVSLALVLGRWGGQTVRHWAVTGFKYLTGRTYRSSGSIADTPSGQDSWTGTRWENGKLITVLEISATQRHPSVITPDHCATDSLVPLRVLRECMHQNDIELESIDVISNGQRTAQGTVLRGGYDRLVGPLPAVAIRTVWVVLRFDPGANVDAVFRRGGGRRGAERCAVIATARVRRALAAAHCASTILQAGQIHRISAEMLRQYAGAPMHEDWSGLTLIDSYNVAMGIDPWYITDATLTGLWARPTLETSVTVRLRPAAKGRTSVGALVRWATDEQLPVRHSTGMTSLNGSQRDAFFAGLPVGAIGLEYLTRSIEMSNEELDGIHLPTSGCGQLIGSDMSGRAIATRLSGQGVHTVVVRAELYVCQQVVLRAVAIGALVVVYTDRPHMWDVMVTSIGDANRIQFASGPGFIDPRCTLAVVDGMQPTALPSNCTALHIISSEYDALPARPDVIIDQPNGYGDHILLTAGGETIQVRLVTVSDELAYLGRPIQAFAQ
ncbi:ESX-5 secretion system protein EccE5 [Mycobacteroides abscessus subsp. abscessus]|nr:ESX-5 secretion system protein EccE5 [Mycobacteroides abscessus subsp. abscessus]